MPDPNDPTFGRDKFSKEKRAIDTHNAAMQIVGAEAEAREKKTRRLRQLRLESEAANPASQSDRKGRGVKKRT